MHKSVNPTIATRNVTVKISEITKVFFFYILLLTSAAGIPKLL